MLAVLATAFVTATTGILTNLASNDIHLHGAGRTIIVWGGLAIFSILGAVIVLRTGQTQPKDPFGSAVDALRRDLLSRWSADPVWESVNEGGRMPIRWTPVAIGTLSAKSAVWKKGRFTSDGARLASLFQAAQMPKRLVVLGEPGIGKSELLVAAFRSMLTAWAADRPLPVLIPMTAWRPAPRPADWIIDWLHLNHRSLRRQISDGSGRTVAEALVEENRLAFILDGLDEMAPEFRADALGSMNNLDPNLLIMLSSRATEYKSIGNAANLLTDTRGIELDGQRPADAMRYLTRRSKAPGAWALVESSLARHWALSQAFKTPLMVMLADTMYNQAHEEAKNPGPRPEDLLSLAGYRELTDHLLGEFVPSRYAPGAKLPHGIRQWKVDEASRGLGYLAQMLGEDTDLRWWDLVVLPARARRGRGRILLTAGAVTVWTALSAGFLNQWTFIVPHTGVTDAVRIASAALLSYLTMLYLSGNDGDALLAATGAYIAGALSGSYDLAVCVGIVVGFTWRTAGGSSRTPLRRGRLRDAVAVGVAAAAVAGAVRAAGLLVSLTPSLTQAFGGGAVDGFASRWDEDANGWIATGFVTAAVVWAGLVVSRDSANPPARSFSSHPVRYGTSAGVLVAAINTWSDSFGKVEHAWLIAPADGFAVGVALWWLTHWTGIRSARTPAPRRIPPAVAGAFVAVAGAALNIVGYSTRTDIHAAWARGLAEGLCLGLLVWLTLDLTGPQTRSVRVEARKTPGDQIRSLALAIAAALIIGLLDAVSAGIGRGTATAVGICLAVFFLLRRSADRVVETNAGEISPVEVGFFVLVLVGLIAGFGYALMFGVIAGLGCRVARDIALRRQPSGRALPSARGSVAGVLLGSIPVLGATFNGTPAPWLVLIGLTSAVAGAFTFGIASKDPERIPAASPYALYKQDRADFALLTLAIAVALGTAVGARAAAISGSLSVAALAGAGTLLTYGVSAGLVMSTTATRFLAFTVIRFRLYYRGCVPWSLMAFLDDAHRYRLVLRSAGAAYQFRHRDLKEKIAEGSPVPRSEWVTRGKEPA
jgi:hypothetical protein